MIDIEIRDRNKIVTLSVPTKAPIRSSSGSQYFYNSMELLCIAVGSCFGKEMVHYCAEKEINPRVFESVKVTMENFIPIIILSHPKDMDPELLKDISLIARTCPIAKLLQRGVEIKLVENNIPTEDLIDETKNSGCCGGGNAETKKS